MWFTVAHASSKLAGGGTTEARKSCACFRALYSSPRTLERCSAKYPSAANAMSANRGTAMSMFTLPPILSRRSISPPFQSVRNLDDV